MQVARVGPTVQNQKIEKGGDIGVQRATIGLDLRKE